jgi:hypothetical protein
MTFLSLFMNSHALETPATAVYSRRQSSPLEFATPGAAVNHLL